MKSAQQSSRYDRFVGLKRQIRGASPFAGECEPSRVSLFTSPVRRPTLPFPHPWNYRDPIRILESCFVGADEIQGPGRHNRYLDVFGFTPILISRDPGIIEAIMIQTGDSEGQFDRDTLPFVGIANATGMNTLLSSNGADWRRQRKMAANPFGKTKIFQLDRFHEFEQTFRQTAIARIGALREHLAKNGQNSVTIRMEPEVKVIMLEMLVNNFFGAEISHDELKKQYLPALERIIEHIVRDTIFGQLAFIGWGISLYRSRIKTYREDNAVFERLTDHVLTGRSAGRGLWRQFKAEAPDDALRGNLKVFLAGAIEATTSYACWAIAHLARNANAQSKVFEDVKDIDEYTPENLRRAEYLGHVLNEALRLTPSLYFLPRRGTSDVWIETRRGGKMFIPKGIHILLDIWHANRHEDHWGVAATGYPAMSFVPERWENIESRRQSSKDLMHFGFGHGARICPGQHLGQLEAALVVGAFVKLFTFKSPTQEYGCTAGVSTKPKDGTLVELALR